MNNEERILQILTAMQSDLAGLKEGQESLMQGQERLEQRQEKLEQRQEKLEQRQEKLEQRQEKLEQRQEKLEQRQEKLEQRQEEMQETLTRVAVTQEGLVLPRLQALYEGHGAIMERQAGLAEKNRVEELEDDVAMLKNSVKRMRVEINELKRA